MKLPLRASPVAEPQELEADPQQHSGGLPWLWGSLLIASSQPLTLVLRIHNQAGIPIIEGRSEVPAGEQRFVFRELVPLGIEGYAHVQDERRAEVARRMWTRSAYGTLSVRRAGQPEERERC